MDDLQREAITAICDVGQEGFIAASLIRLGWQVIYRATSAEGLKVALEENPSALLIHSEDFKSEAISAFQSVLTIAAKSKSKASGRYLDPLNDFNLQEALRECQSEKVHNVKRLEPCPSDVTVICATQAGIGTSTLALNLAQEYFLAGKSTLLLDCNLRSPYLSSALGIPRIDRNLQVTQFGFSIGEPASLENLTSTSLSAATFEKVIIDLGLHPAVEQVIAGRRFEELLATWALQSAHQIILLSRESQRSLRKMQSAIMEGERAPISSNYLIGIMLHSPLGRRERASLSSKVREISGKSALLFSSDRRSVEGAELQEGTLAKVAAKSRLRGEIISYLLPSPEKRRANPK